MCTRGEKEHTSKRVSVIACDNVISKAKLSGTPRDTVYSRGKGVCEHKTTDCRLRQSVGQKRSIRRVAGALHIRAKVPYGHRTPKLRFGFSAAHRRHKKKTTKTVVLFFMVPVAGLEPARYRYRWILSPLRLPIPSHRHKLLNHSSTTILFLQLI